MLLIPRHDGKPRVKQKFGGLHGRSQTGDAYHDVKRSLGAHEGNAGHGGQPVEQHEPPAIQFFYHIRNVSLRAAQSGDGPPLRIGAGAHGGILMRAIDGGYEPFRTRRVPDARACHGIGFGKAVQDDGTFAHTGQRGDADVFLAVKDDLLIDFVADDDEIMPDRQIRDALQRFARINRSCGVLG